jgi:hypothetical protein
MKLFRRTGKAEKNWRGKAWVVDPKKTRIVFVHGEASARAALDM